MVRMDGDYPALEVVLRKKEGQTLIHLVNSTGAPDTAEYRHSGIVPSTGPVRSAHPAFTRPFESVD